MCHERERLTGYIYDECDPQERQQVDAHLAGCPTCREELSGLRRVRQDLLAWDVPEHGSVWRPFAPPRPRFSWSDVPAWAMAAAAGVIFLAGAAGGVATRAWLPAAAQAPSAMATEMRGITAVDIAAIEARLADRVRAEVSARTSPVSHPATQAGDDAQRVAEQIASLEREYLEWKNDQRSLIVQLTNDVLGLKRARAAGYDVVQTSFNR